VEGNGRGLKNNNPGICMEELSKTMKPSIWMAWTLAKFKLGIPRRQF
jgi:hypothetical protein